MLELFRKRIEELEAEIKSQEITSEELAEIEAKAAEYKQDLIDELKISKEEKASAAAVKLEEVKKLAEEFDAQPVTINVPEETPITGEIHVEVKEPVEEAEKEEAPVVEAPKVAFGSY